MKWPTVSEIILAIQDHKVKIHVNLLLIHVFVETISRYSVPHEEEQKSFFLHFSSYLRNQVSYDHVAGTIMIFYPY